MQETYSKEIEELAIGARRSQRYGIISDNPRKSH